MFQGKEFLLERTLLGDYALIKAWKADTKGNCVLKLANRNLNPDMATAGKICIVEADEIVEMGQIDGDDIHIAGIFVHRVVKSTPNPELNCGAHTCPVGTGSAGKIHEMMLKRAAKEIKNGNYVVFGCGMPKALGKFIPSDLDVHVVIPETGIFGAVHKCGDKVNDLADACLTPVELRKNAAITKVSDAFAGLRGGHFHKFFSEAYQVSEHGDLANIEKGDKLFPSPGITMDLATAQTPIVALMEMSSNGKPNLVKECTYKVSGKKCVSKLVTDMGVFEFRADGLTLIETAPDVTVDAIKAKTPVAFKVAADLKQMC
jgi:3-oxoacid CoA-transferase